MVFLADGILKAVSEASMATVSVSLCCGRSNGLSPVIPSVVLPQAPHRRYHQEIVRMKTRKFYSAQNGFGSHKITAGFTAGFTAEFTVNTNPLKQFILESRVHSWYSEPKSRPKPQTRYRNNELLPLQQQLSFQVLLNRQNKLA